MHKYPRYFVGINGCFPYLKYFRVDSFNRHTNFYANSAVGNSDCSEGSVRYWLREGMIREVKIEELVLMF